MIVTQRRGEDREEKEHRRIVCEGGENREDGKREVQTIRKGDIR